VATHWKVHRPEFVTGRDLQKLQAYAYQPMKSDMKLTLAVSCAAALLTSAQAANFIINGDFESPVVLGLFLTTPVLPGWTVSGNVDVINSYWQPSQGNQSLDMVGNTGPGTFIEQSFATTPGLSYRLTFDYANNSDAAFARGNVSVTGTASLLSTDINHSGSIASNMGYVAFDTVFVTDSAVTTLRYTHLDSSNPSNAGIAFDNVSVTAVPEPSTYAVVSGLALLGFACWQRRR